MFVVISGAVSATQTCSTDNVVHWQGPRTLQVPVFPHWKPVFSYVLGIDRCRKKKARTLAHTAGSSGTARLFWRNVLVPQRLPSAVCHTRVTFLSLRAWADMSEILSSFCLKDDRLLHSCPAHVTPNIIMFPNRVWSLFHPVNLIVFFCGRSTSICLLCLA